MSKKFDFKELNNISKEDRILKKIIAKNYLDNGKIKTWKGDFFEVKSPIKIKKRSNYQDLVIGKYPLMNEEAALQMVNNAYEAYNFGKGAWPLMQFTNRIKCFEKFLDLMRKQRENIVTCLMWEIGKNKADSQKEFDRTIEYIEKTIVEIKRRVNNYNGFIEEGGVIGQVKRAPLGVVLCMGPYNYPLNESFTTLIPAMLMGNTVIFKPPKRGVLLHNYLIEAFNESFPSGVFNIVYGEGEEVVKPIMESGKVSVLAFIGSSKVANIIERYHPKLNRLRSVLGLEAKNVGIVTKHCDLDNVVNECVLGSLSFNGQRCTALKLLYVHEDILYKFINKFIIKVKSLSIGLPFDNCNITPVPYENIKYYKELVEDAISKGAKLKTNSKDDFETFYGPKVLVNVNEHMRIFHEEQFGPIVPIVSFKNLDEPINTITRSNYGQQCSIFGNNPKEVGYLIDNLVHQVARTNLNTQSQRGPDTFPFGGRKDSAVGTLSITDALKRFSTRTLVSAKLNDVNRDLYKKIIKEDCSAYLEKELLL